MDDNVRKVTCKVLEAMDEGMLDPKAIAEMCLSALSEDEVCQMLRANDHLWLLEDDEEDGSDDDDIDDDDDDWFEEELISREIRNPVAQFPWLTDDDVD